MNKGFNSGARENKAYRDRDSLAFSRTIFSALFERSLELGRLFVGEREAERLLSTATFGDLDLERDWDLFRVDFVSDRSSKDHS